MQALRASSKGPIENMVHLEMLCTRLMVIARVRVALRGEEANKACPPISALFTGASSDFGHTC